MIAYNFVIVEGNIHENSMEVQIGTSYIGLDCVVLRKLIIMANKIGVYQVLENINLEGREIFTFLYEEFKDKL